MKQLTKKPSKWGGALKGIAALLPVGALALGLAFSFNAAAVTPSTVVVTPTNAQGWSTADTTAGGSVDFVADATSPLPTGALQLTTDGTNAAKAQYMHTTNVALADVTDLSYYTKQIAASSPDGDASYQLAVDLNGDAAGGFTTLVYEPYWNGTVVPSTWQPWDVDSGTFWSSRSFTDPANTDCTVTAGAGGNSIYTLEGLTAACPDAVVSGFGVNVGTYNPNYQIEVDGVNFNGVTYNFEVSQSAAAAREACKNGGYQTLVDTKGNSYKNQGQCVADVSSSSNSNMHKQ